MSLEGCRHAVLSGGWGTSCKKDALRPNITLTLWQTLGGLPPQIENQGSTTTIKKQMINNQLAGEKQTSGLQGENFH